MIPKGNTICYIMLICFYVTSARGPPRGSRGQQIEPGTAPRCSYRAAAEVHMWWCASMRWPFLAKTRIRRTFDVEALTSCKTLTQRTPPSVHLCSGSPRSNCPGSNCPGDAWPRLFRSPAASAPSRRLRKGAPRAYLYTSCDGTTLVCPARSHNVCFAAWKQHAD